MTKGEELESIFPEVIGAVITSRGNIVNLCPINFQAVSTVYENPTTVCIGLSNTSYSLENIQTNKQFIYAYPSESQTEDVIYCGTVSGRDINKLDKTNLKFSESTNIKPPNLEGAIVNFECELVHSYVAGNFTIIVAKVLRINQGSGYNWQKIYSLGGQKYGTIDIKQVIKHGR